MLIGLTITVLSTSNWTHVRDFAQLKSAVESATVTHIRLTNNIQIPRNGAEINGNKSELVIDGAGFRITGHSSNTRTDTLRYARAGRLNNITVTNLEIVSSNNNGFINVASGSNMANVNLTFRDISFFGPQLVSAVDSSVVIGNGNYVITGGHCKLAHELAEAHHIRLENNVTIYKDAAGKDEIFRIERAGGGITVATGAYVNVSLNQHQRKANRAGFVHFQRDNGYLRFQDDSFFNFVGNAFFQQHKDIREFIVGDRAEVYIRTHGNFKGCYGIVNITGQMVAGENSIVNLIATGNTKKDPVIQLNSRTSSVTLNSPKQFYVYNSSTKGVKGNAIGTSSCTNVANLFYNDITNVAYWRDNTSPHDNLRNPNFSWVNPNESHFSLFSSSTRTKVNSVGNTGYFGNTPFNAANAHLRDVNVILIGGGTGGGGIIEPDVHLVSFNSNGGTFVDPQYVEDLNRISKPDDPFRHGLIFAGWYLDPHFSGQPWDFSHNLVTTDITLHALWVFDDGTMPLIEELDLDEFIPEQEPEFDPEQDVAFELEPEQEPTDDLPELELSPELEQTAPESDYELELEG